MVTALQTGGASDAGASGEFVDFGGERYYVIRNVDRLAPFFISVISNVDHWLFVSSTGGLTAGRVSPDTALFPYITVDKIHDSVPHTGPKTLLRVHADGREFEWEPFNSEQDGQYVTSRSLYKNLLGNKLCLEEINHDLRLAFRYTWMSSDAYGFVRRCELHNAGDQGVGIELLDGLQNILPAGTPRFSQTNVSNLVDAYKWTELDVDTGLALFTLYSGISDRAEPCESLKANTVFSLGLEAPGILLSSEQLENFRRAEALHGEVHKRGIRGAFFVSEAFELGANASREWQIVANIEQSQGEVVELRERLADPARLARDIDESVANGSEGLARIMAVTDGFQATVEETVSVHHYANVLFNVLRGGYFYDQYDVLSRDFARTIKHFNRDVHDRNRDLLAGLPDALPFADLAARVAAAGDSQLARLCAEYLPITFGRRHGDPSRPWNQFAIRLKDGDGNPLLSYEGNWRDIFQNWEALAFSYPEFVENMIAKFVNASTADGYNPYRITKEGIDWEVEEPDDPWSYIGYWGDHQIIYLQKLLELSQHFHPARLDQLLHRPIFCYANVPYRIRPFDALLENHKQTVDYDEALAERIEQRVAAVGADGKLIPDEDGSVYQVNLLEKLVVPLLAKLGNLVVDGGIWMNTQRPEWNDANNALVGHGLSMVTLCYMRRYVTFLSRLIAAETGTFELSDDVSRWLTDTASALGKLRPLLEAGAVSAEQRYASLVDLGQAASRYRETVYARESFTGKTSVPIERLSELLDDALAAIEHSIQSSVRDDGLYHAYNLLDIEGQSLSIGSLYPMLEGQVAALSSGGIDAEEAVEVLEALFASDLYRPDQRSFLLYPDRDLPGFLDKNRVPAERVATIPLLQRLLEEGDESIIVRDAEGQHRFCADFSNVTDMEARLDALAETYGDELEAAREPLRELFETVFNHQAFTGRSGTMFGFEGLGCIYWHMVSKLLLAVQETFYHAVEERADQGACRKLGQLYYRVRAGLGFNKTPAEYGAFPTDPYSHTPKQRGAQQPGMTGQVKEEVLARFGELGARVSDGRIHFRPDLLRAREFVAEAREFCYLDIDGSWQNLTVPARGLAFTWCQVPVIYRLDDDTRPALTLTLDDGEQQTFEQLALPVELSAELFARIGRIRRITVTLDADVLFTD